MRLSRSIFAGFDIPIDGFDGVPRFGDVVHMRRASRTFGPAKQFTTARCHTGRGGSTNDPGSQGGRTVTPTTASTLSGPYT